MMSLVWFIAFITSNMIWVSATIILYDNRITRSGYVIEYIKKNPTKNGIDAAQCVNIKALNTDRNIEMIIDHKWLNKCVGK